MNSCKLNDLGDSKTTHLSPLSLSLSLCVCVYTLTHAHTPELIRKRCLIQFTIRAVSLKTVAASPVKYRPL